MTAVRTWDDVYEPERGSIERDTPILPWVIAETVVQEADASPDQVAQLVARAEQVYAMNARFRKVIRSRGNRGRDTLYAFMHHWVRAARTA